MAGPDPTAVSWRPDLLAGYETTDLALAPDRAPGEESDIVATLVRRIRLVDPPGAPRAVLYLHGWNDYFFQRHVADYWQRAGYRFHALELRRYGRSLRFGQLNGFITDLSDYDAEIDAAMAIIGADHDEILLTGHSTGGLIAALWAHRHPGRTIGLVLNSPWLDLQGAPIVRPLGALIDVVGARASTTVLRLTDVGLYARTLHVDLGGEWDYDLEWKTTPSPPIRVGWLRAILRGHAAIASGLSIDVPVLVLCSDRTLFRRRWSEELRRVDAVLDVEQIAGRAHRLGGCVTVVRIADGMHDLSLSAAPVRARFFAEIDRWSGSYLR